jgi:phosphoribosylformylglycinamidine synthase
MKFGVVVFPGSNCDRDMIHVCGQVLGCEVISLWHKSTDLTAFTAEDCIVLPGGFSFGDYLRTGAIARFSPIMEEVIKFANKGGKVLGICNGFQILCESGLLPGVLLRNKNQKFYCSNQTVKVVNAKTPFTHLAEANQLLSIPVAHAEGRYYCDEPTLAELKKNNQILFQYCDAKGQLSEEANFNGSIESIAGVINKGGNVFGMMPHPERAAESALFNIDGLNLIKGLSSLSKVAHA